MGETISEVPETARRRRTRERLMDAAHKLFASQGVHAVSIEAIAEAAGYTRGAFYSNFANKNELFFAMMRREVELQLDRLRAAIARNMDAGSGRATLESGFLAEVIQEIFSALPDDPTWTLIHSEFELLALRDPAAAPEFLANEALFRAELSEVLVATATTLGLRFRIDPLLVTDLVLAQGKQAMREMILRGAEDPAIATHDIVLKTMPAVLQQLLEPIEP